MNNKFLSQVFILLMTSTLFCLDATAQNMDNDPSNPFKLSVTYTGDAFANTTGGRATGVRYMDNIDVNLEVNLGGLPLGLEETTFYIYGLGNQGGSISSLAGDVQGISNIEAENSWRIFEFWVQKKFLLANSSLLVGLYDINSEFNVLNSSLLFLNSSHGLDPTIALSGRLGPSTFPYTSMAARLKINVHKGWVVQGAVLDGVPSDPGNTKGTKIFFRESDGIFGIAEIGYHSFGAQDLQMRTRTARLQSILTPGIESNNKAAVGGWIYSEERISQTGAGTNLEYGFYVIGEYELIKRDPELKGPNDLRIFGRLGYSNPNVTIAESYVGAGFTVSGLFPGRSNDQTGLAFASIMAGNEYINHTFTNGSRPQKFETNFELTHQFVLNDYFRLQPNIQYILNPGFNAALDNALIIGTRMSIGF